MLTIPRDQTTLDRLRKLLDEIFQTRDELYAAADSLADADRSYICRWLGKRLGGHAADLQQIITASGGSPAPLGSSRDAATTRASIQYESSDGVLDAAEQMGRALTQRYQLAMEDLEDQEVTSFLGKQREESEFADRVLRCLTK